MTVGISELAMGFTKTCRGCGHKMSLHLGAQATTPQPTVTVQQPTPVPAPSQGPPPGWYGDAQGANRWWDGLQWTEHVQHSMPPAPPAASSF
ncbi:DUF2510 domain-containing protein [Sphingomonas sp. LR61]|uniref:DUF2510 domain-containing protein n=1 Tax=Sphingomonas sp. LR61 TaxID=3050234 RepID=UPI002FE117EE